MYKKLLLVSLSLASVYSSTIDTKKFTIGEQIYKETCISCHGVNGDAKTDMKLIVKPRDLSKTLLTEEQSYRITKHGARYFGSKADIMPAFKYVYNESQLKSVAYYISHNFNSNRDNRIQKLLNESKTEKDLLKNPKYIRWGKKIFNRNCKFCHGISGAGDGIATKNPEDSIYPYDLRKVVLTKDQIFLYIKYGGKHFGTNKDDMPSWKRKYNDFKLRAVTKYIEENIRK